MCIRDRDDLLIKTLSSLKIPFKTGSEKNVLKRFYKTAKKFKSDVIVRITSDCPFIDHNMIDKMVKILLDKKKDYVTNASPPSFPDGLDIEVFNLDGTSQSITTPNGTDYFDITNSA